MRFFLILLSVCSGLLFNNTVHARSLVEYEGKPLTGFELRDLQGNDIDLDDYKGRVVLVNFWATWCPPCRKEMPSMQRLKTALAGAPFEILAIDVGESPKQVRRYIEEADWKPSFPVLLDIAGDIVDLWQVKAFPTTYVLDAQGQARYVLYGATEWDEADKVEAIHQLIAESSSS